MLCRWLKRSRLSGLAHQILDVHEHGLLLQRLGREVVDVPAAGLEAQVQTLDVRAEVKLLLVVRAARLDAQVERTQLAKLHLLALEELLQETVGQLERHALADVLTVDRIVLGHVFDELAIGHRLGGSHFAVILAVAGWHLLVLVLTNLD